MPNDKKKTYEDRFQSLFGDPEPPPHISPPPRITAFDAPEEDDLENEVTKCINKSDVKVTIRFDPKEKAKDEDLITTTEIKKDELLD